MDDQLELLWKRYETNVNLYKFYFNIVIKYTIFHYAITGAIVSFYFGKTPESVNYIKYSLLLPVVISFIFGIIYIVGTSLMNNIRKELDAIMRILASVTADKVGFLTFPETRVLNAVLWVFGIFFICIGLVLLGLFLFRV